MAAQSKNCFERYEKKYRLTAAQQRMVLEGMRPYMKKDAYGAYTICNIYYDTDDWRLIRASLEKPVYKEKLRVRSYGVPDGDGKVFVELKKKYDGVVYKRRVTMGAGEAAPFLAGDIPNAHGQIGQEILWFQRFYQARPRCSSPMTGWPLPGSTIRSCGSPSTPTCDGGTPRLTCGWGTMARPSPTPA